MQKKFLHHAFHHNPREVCGDTGFGFYGQWFAVWLNRQCVNNFIVYSISSVTAERVH